MQRSTRTLAFLLAATAARWIQGRSNDDSTHDFEWSWTVASFGADMHAEGKDVLPKAVAAGITNKLCSLLTYLTNNCS